MASHESPAGAHPEQAELTPESVPEAPEKNERREAAKLGIFYFENGNAPGSFYVGNNLHVWGLRWQGGFPMRMDERSLITDKETGKKYYSPSEKIQKEEMESGTLEETPTVQINGRNGWAINSAPDFWENHGWEEVKDDPELQRKDYFEINKEES